MISNKKTKIFQILSIKLIHHIFLFVETSTLLLSSELHATFGGIINESFWKLALESHFAFKHFKEFSHQTYEEIYRKINRWIKLGYIDYSIILKEPYKNREPADVFSHYDLEHLRDIKRKQDGKNYMYYVTLSCQLKERQEEFFHKCDFLEKDELLTLICDEELTVLQMAKHFPIGVKVPNFIKTNRKAILKIIKRNGHIYRLLSDDLKNDREIAKLAFLDEPTIIISATDEIKNDFEMVSLAMRSSSDIFLIASNDLKKNKQFIIQAIKSGTIKLLLLQSHNEDNDDLANEISTILKYFSDDEDVIKELIISDDMEPCEFASDRLKNNYSFAKFAVSHNDHNYIYLSESMQTERDIVQILIDKDSFYQSYIPEKYWEEREYRYNPKIFKNLINEKKVDVLFEWLE